MDPHEPLRPPIRGIRSFENLVALANYREALQDARKMVWRDRGEPATQLDTLRECLRHAGKGGMRAGTLGFLLRSGFNAFVLLFRIWRAPRHFRFSLIRHALLGPDSFRFGAMLGTFVAVYKFLLNTFPILLPPSSSPSELSSPSSPSEQPVTIAPLPSERKRGKLSLRAQVHESWVRKKTRPWHAIVAGAVSGGVGILFEKKSRRLTIAQQLFVRGLQGSYNAFSSRHGFKIPHGAIIVFSLCCGQIMYGWLLRPDTIPKAYSQWILTASKAPPQAVNINRSLVRDGVIHIPDLELLIDNELATPKNHSALVERLARARTGDFGPRYAPCAAVHPWLDSCYDVPIDRFFAVFKWMFPIYGALHFIPMILFKRKQVFEEPLRMLLRAGWGTTRSAAFLGTFVIIYQSLFFCFKHNTHFLFTSRNAPFKVPRWLVDLLISKSSFFVGGLTTGVSLFVEERRRRAELAMYVLPKGLESVWIMARGKGYVFKTGNYGESLLCAIGMGMVMNIYQNDPQQLSGFVRRILYQFIGPN